MELLRLGLLAATLCFVSAQEKCGECDASACPKTKDQVLQTCTSAKAVLDRCNCCYVCAQIEGEACDLKDQPYKFGECGFNMNCLERKDGTTAGVCRCLDERKVCATNGLTYDNMCKLQADSIRLRDPKLTVDGLGACKKAPKIISKPKDVKNATGNNVALLCEASGNPIPYMLWLYTSANGDTENLPGSDTSVSVVIRGGPEEHQITGWLQIMDVKKYHEGDYTCLIKSTQGDEQAVARVKVMDGIIRISCDTGEIPCDTSIEGGDVVSAEEEDDENETR